MVFWASIGQGGGSLPWIWLAAGAGIPWPRAEQGQQVPALQPPSGLRVQGRLPPPLPPPPLAFSEEKCVSKALVRRLLAAA